MLQKAIAKSHNNVLSIRIEFEFQRDSRTFAKTGAGVDDSELRSHFDDFILLDGIVPRIGVALVGLEMKSLSENVVFLYPLLQPLLMGRVFVVVQIHPDSPQVSPGEFRCNFILLIL
jgi:hypothetical protein